MNRSITVNIQSSIRISGSKTVCFDPWKLSESYPADAVFITHDHFDHFSPEDIKKTAGEKTLIVFPACMSEKINEMSLPTARLLPVVPGKAYSDGDISFLTVAAYNPNKPFHPKDAGYCGYCVKLDGDDVFVTGDTDATPENEAVSCDILLIPIGGKYTMDVPQAAELTCRIKPKLVIPTHYGEVVGSADDGKAFEDAVLKKDPEIKVQIILHS